MAAEIPWPKGRACRPAISFEALQDDSPPRAPASSSVAALRQSGRPCPRSKIATPMGEPVITSAILLRFPLATRIGRVARQGGGSPSPSVAWSSGTKAGGKGRSLAESLCAAGATALHRLKRQTQALAAELDDYWLDLGRALLPRPRREPGA
jgi:hypothetical protein